MTINKDGTFDEDTTEEILEGMIANANEYWGEDLKDENEAVVRKFYEPIAERFAVSQQDIGAVLASAQIENAEGGGLDLLTSLIGVRRREAMKSMGTATFKHKTDGTAASRDYTIAQRTVVQTEGTTPIRFETTETAILKAGNSTVDVPIRAIEPGIQSNVGANTLRIMPDSPIGIRDVTNPSATSGGRDEETDESLRERAKDNLGKGSRASGHALVNTTRPLEGVRGVSIFINDTSTDKTGNGGLPDHSFELVVQGGNKQEIADTILKTKAAGDNSYAGVYGSEVVVSSELPNGQLRDVSFSRPNQVKIYIDMDLKVDDEYVGDDEVRNSIVRYIGGVLASANDEGGDILVGENVLYGRVEYAIRDVQGVYDVNSLYIGTSADPTGEQDIPIDFNEISTTDGTDSSIGITTTEITF